MNGNWSGMPEARRAALYRRLAVEMAADDLVSADAPPGAAPRRPRFDELRAAALDPDAPPSAAVTAALAADGESRRAFEALLRDTAVCWFPAAAAAAAAGDGLDAREGDGFEIRIMPSSADDRQVHVLIRIAEGRDAAPAALVAIPAQGGPVRAALPEDIDGVYHLIELGDSPLVRAIRDPASKLALV